MSIGLYYPYVHFRNMAWIKAAALYMPQLVRVVPAGFTLADPRDVRVLHDGLGFVDNFDPADAVEAASQHMLALVKAHGDDLRRSFGIHRAQDLRAAGGVNAEPSPPGTAPQVRSLHQASRFGERPLAGLHPGEMVAHLREALQDCGLAVPAVRNSVRRRSGPEWLGMDPALAWVYKCALTAEVAHRTAFVPLTDQVAAHTAADLWDTERMAAALLGETEILMEAPDLTSRIGILSIEYVLPARLASVPAEKIVELRTKYELEFLAYSDAVEQTAKTLQENVGHIASRQAMEMHLREAVHRDFETEVNTLRKAMYGLGLQSITTAVSTKFEMPTSVALASAASASVAGSMMGTLTGAAGTAAVAAFGIVTGARRQTAQALAANPASFLLRVERGLTPTTLWKRVNGALRRNLGAGV
ncbi:DUF6236 family protein [Streptomyces sp. IBSBF 3136]|uniref:DUF6236 family protein n=1 Tax=Streptomyces sp. IBSBF 3136 TaxID=2903524 RepID=UPI002FDBE024